MAAFYCPIISDGHCVTVVSAASIIYAVHPIGAAAAIVRGYVPLWPDTGAITPPSSLGPSSHCLRLTVVSKDLIRFVICRHPWCWSRWTSFVHSSSAAAASVATFGTEAYLKYRSLYSISI